LKIAKHYTLEDCKDLKNDLLKEFGSNKIIPGPFQLQALIALSHFPELKEINIRFIFSKATLAYASRPAIKSIFQPPLKREYLIILSTYSSKVPKELLFANLPFNAQVGILGHELSHTSYYLNKTATQLISTGFNYLNSKYRVKFENETDKRTIQKGLGWQLLEFAKYNREHPKASSQLVHWLNKFYLPPSRILSYIQTLPEYKK
jgi:hypothetical protein